MKFTTAGRSYIILNVIRLSNILTLLLTMASSAVLLAQTVTTSRLFFLAGLGHLIVALFAAALLSTELGLFRRCRQHYWPLFAVNHGFVALGCSMTTIGVLILGQLNATSGSRERLPSAGWRCTLSAGIIASVLGIINVTASYSFRDKTKHLSARQIRRHGSSADQIVSWDDAAPVVQVSSKSNPRPATMFFKKLNAFRQSSPKAPRIHVSAPVLQHSEQRPCPLEPFRYHERRTSSVYSNDYQKGGQGGTGMPPVLDGTQRPEMAYHPAYQNISLTFFALLAPCFGTFIDKTAPYVVHSLPNVSFDLPKSYAGQIGIPNRGNNRLFFWLWETEDVAYEDNLIIWLNGGPGCSSMQGLAKENGPLQFYGDDKTPSRNPYSWTKLGHVLYIDQPAGAGYSMGDRPPQNNAEVTQDFVAWLDAFLHIFTPFRGKKIYITGESWAGTYIPYFARALLEARDRLPLTIQAISIGDGTFGNPAALTSVVTTSYMTQQNSVLKIPQDVLSIFQGADRKCQFDKTLRQIQYPPKGKIVIEGNPEGRNLRKRQMGDDGCQTNLSSSDRIQKSIDECGGGCATAFTGLAYMRYRNPKFNSYNIKSTTPPTRYLQEYLNQKAVRDAIHAPNKTFELCSSALQDILAGENVEPAAYHVLPAVLAHGVRVLIYSGKYDFLLNHLGAQLAIQNMTWEGLQGFQRRPQKPFVVAGQSWGVWGQERGLSFFQLDQIGHMLPLDQPAVAFTLIKDFLL